MSNKEADQSSNSGPTSNFYFQAGLSSTDAKMSFQEVTGLESEIPAIEYRHKESKEFSTIKMPGTPKSGRVTLRKCIIFKDTYFFEWYQNIKRNALKKETIVLQLFDESGNVKMSWSLHKAWPTKITGTNLSQDSNEVQVESIEIAYETMIIAMP